MVLMTNVQRINWKTQPVQAIDSLLAAFESDSRTLSAFAASRRINPAGFREAAMRLFPARMKKAMEAKIRKSTPYTRGRALEYRVSHDLQKFGYHVQRAAGSRGAMDLTAITRGLNLFVQVKANGAISPEERTALVTLANSVGALPILAERKDGRTLRYWIINEGTSRKEFFPNAKSN